MSEDRLTALDATFLELEESDDSAHMHIGGVMVFDALPQGGAPATAELARHLERRMPELPRYRQRLSEPRTGGVRWPDWEVDPNFSTAAHIRRASLPSPGGEAELFEWAGEYYSQRLDRRRPLWEIVVLDGLAGGRWAMVTKTHHCMVDGIGSVDIGHTILDTERVPSRRGPIGPRSEAGAEPEQPVDAIGRGRALGSDAAAAAAALVRLPLRVAEAGLGMVRHPEQARDALHRSRATASLLMRDEVLAAPNTSLNEPIGAHRRLAVMRAPLADLKLVKNALGGTVNDVVLTVAASGLRELLQGRGEALPHQGLRAMVPMNIRSAGEHLELGNKITSLFVHLPVDEPDTLIRYQRQMDEAETLKSGSQAVGSKTMIDVAGLAPPALHSFIARSLFATRLFNVTVTNVPGPQATLYAFGVRLREIWPLVPIAASHAIGLAVLSYDGELFFCVNADRDTAPDVDVMVDGMRAALRELRELAAETAAEPV